MTWELKEVTPKECMMDDSGLYCVVNRVVKTVVHKEHSGEIVAVRVDIMDTEAQEPLMSFVGNANDVRKHVIDYLMHQHVDTKFPITREHASYIGYEIARAAAEPDFIQD